MPIPKIIHQVQFGPFTPKVEQWMYSVKRNHPDWEIHVWDEFNLSELGLEYLPLIHECQNFASLSNIVRLHALHKFGGVYLDTDMEVIKPLDPLLEHEAFCALQDKIVFEKDVGRVCNAVMAASPGHPWIDWQIKNQDALKTGDAAFGVYLASAAPREGVKILPTEFFYPFLWDGLPHERRPHQDSYAVHHWSGSWSKKL